MSKVEYSKLFENNPNHLKLLKLEKEAVNDSSGLSCRSTSSSDFEKLSIDI